MAKYPAEPLTAHEIRALLAACSSRCPTGIRNRALIVVLWRAGLRISEALSLEPRDAADGVLRVRHGKGDKARTVAIDPQGLAVLQLWIECKARLGIGGPIFSTLKGGPILSAYIRNLMKRIGRKAGLTKRIHAHGLRHTFAAGLADEKVDVRIIQRALGHSSLAVTDRYISHLMPTAVIDALKARVW
jgi:integrase